MDGNQTAEPSLTFFTLQSHSGLQVVHLELKTFKGAIGIPRLPLIGYQHRDDDQQQQAAAPSDADDGRKRQQAVRVDVKRPGGVLEAPGSDLNTQTPQVNVSLEAEPLIYEKRSNVGGLRREKIIKL